MELSMSELTTTEQLQVHEHDSVIMLSVILSVKFLFSFILNGILLSVIFLLSMTSFITMANVVILSVAFCIVMLSVTMLNVVLTTVMAQKNSQFG
jgi:hypothetical protein